MVFASVGACCFLVQFGVLTALAAAGTDRPLANAVGFVVSAQLNFLLSSRLTWRDRPASSTRARGARLASYNGTALLSLAVNTGVFTLTYHRVGNLLAAGFGVGCGMFVTYLVCHFLIFRDRRGRVLAAGSALRAAANYTPAHRARASRGSIHEVLASDVPADRVLASPAPGRHRAAGAVSDES